MQLQELPIVFFVKIVSKDATNGFTNKFPYTNLELER